MPSKLLRDQWKFTYKIAILILYAYLRGYKVSFGDAWSKERYGAHKKNSYHYRRLAIDLNLYSKDGKWLKKTEDHAFLGKAWERLGGTWGGHWSDGNHYSWGEY